MMEKPAADTPADDNVTGMTTASTEAQIADERHSDKRLRNLCEEARRLGVFCQSILDQSTSIETKITIMEMINRHAETNKRQAETNKRQAETINRQAETNKRQAETINKYAETDKRQAETINRQAETINRYVQMREVDQKVLKEDD